MSFYHRDLSTKDVTVEIHVVNKMKIISFYKINFIRPYVSSSETITQL